MPKKMNTEEFVKKARNVHGDKYDYSKVEYDGIDRRVCIICPEHGEFWQTPHKHLLGRGCPYCANCAPKNTANFIIDAKKIHGNKYDYSKVKYNGNKTKVCIICPEHGEFWQTPNSHLLGHGCSKCAVKKKSENQKVSLEEFIIRSNKIHNFKYDYSKTILNGLKNKITIICPEHGEFTQIAHDHIGGHGCPKCNCFGKTTGEFIKQAKEVHDNKYDYSKVDYKNKNEKVCIICPEHGEFWQLPLNHLNGCNCPHCSKSKLECDVERILNDNGVQFEYQKKFDWLGKQSLDFYLPDYDLAIECQGRQHFEPVDFGGKGEEYAMNEFADGIKRDEAKKHLCKENHIKLIYYANIKEKSTFLGEKLLKNKKELIENITEKEK